MYTKIFITALFVIPCVAVAQTSTNLNSSQSQAGSLSQSGGATINNAAQLPHTTSTQTLADTGQAIPPGLYGGTNTCEVGASGGVGAVGFDISLGREWSDEGCERRNIAVVLFTYLHNPQAAMIVMCEDPKVDAAMKYTTVPCPQDVGQTQNVAQIQTAQPIKSLSLANKIASDQIVIKKPEFCNEPIGYDQADKTAYNYYCK